MSNTEYVGQKFESLARPFRLSVIEKYHVCDKKCDGQTTDRHTHRRKTDMIFLSLAFINITHVNLLTLRHLFKILFTDRQLKFSKFKLRINFVYKKDKGL